MGEWLSFEVIKKRLQNILEHYQMYDSDVLQSNVQHTYVAVIISMLFWISLRDYNDVSSAIQRLSDGDVAQAGEGPCPSSPRLKGEAFRYRRSSHALTAWHAALSGLRRIVIAMAERLLLFSIQASFGCQWDQGIPDLWAWREMDG